jgi:segregation and condensation protein B
MKKKSPTRLSRAALETLAVIAYRQPILRVELKRSGGGRGRHPQDPDGKGVGPRGRPQGPARKPMIYGTTQKFLQTFDLPSLDALPSLEEIESLGQNDEARLF